jgi:NAD(P)-dependent dehydrogenase (short-subunit alcohol dehydrogenase family)
MVWYMAESVVGGGGVVMVASKLAATGSGALGGHNGCVTDRPIDVERALQADAVDVLAPGRVAVVTGAASGIGLALCRRLSAGGLRVVMADVDGDALGRAAARLTAAGREVLPVITDVSRPEQVDALRDRVVAEFGAVHVVCNNAGVALGGSLWEMTVADWEWVLGVNLWGVINGVRSFVPLLLEQDAGHVVNTASIAGLVPATLGAYSVTKHAVVALSEGLSVELQARGGRVGVSVLCPGWVRTGIAGSHSRRPGTGDGSGPAAGSRAEGMRLAREMVRHAISPDAVAGTVVDAIRMRRFYVLTHPDLNDRIRRRAEAILAGDPPDPTAGA